MRRIRRATRRPASAAPPRARTTPSVTAPASPAGHCSWPETTETRDGRRAQRTQRLQRTQREHTTQRFTQRRSLKAQVTGTCDSDDPSVSFVHLCVLCAVGDLETPTQQHGADREARADRRQEHEVPFL